MAKTSRESFKFMLRLPDDLREQLKAQADISGRSMTAEILFLLEEGLKGHERASPEQVVRLEAENAALRYNFEVIAAQLAGPTGQNRDEVIRVMSALRILGRAVA